MIGPTITLLHSLRRHQFMALSSSVGLAQVLTFLMMPLLTRRYSPSEFGEFALFTAVSTLVGLFASLRLEAAIPVAKDNVEADQVSTLSLFLACSVLVLLQVLVFFWDGVYYTTAVATGFLVAVIQILTQRVLRGGHLRHLAVRLLAEKVVFLAVALGSFRVGVLTFGLIEAQILALSVSVLILWTRSSWVFWRRLGQPVALLLKFRDFLSWNTLSVAVQNIATQGSTIVYAWLFSLAGVGELNVGQRLADAPSALATSAFGSAVYRRILAAPIEDYARIFHRVLLWSLIVFGGGAVFVFVLTPQLVAWLFGAGWEEAGLFVRWLLLPMVARLTFTLLQGFAYVCRRLDLDFRVSAGILLAQVLGLMIGWSMTHTLAGVVAVSSGLLSLVYAFSIWRLWQMVSQFVSTSATK